jgi:hypothetical protein
LHLKDSCKEDIHYKVVDEETWLYLVDKYGGDSIPRLSIAVPTDDGYDHIVEINMRRFTLLAYPRVRYISASVVPEFIFVSRTSTVKELHAIICRKYADDSNLKWTCEELMDATRLWKLEGDETWDDVK